MKNGPQDLLAGHKRDKSDEIEAYFGGAWSFIMVTLETVNLPSSRLPFTVT